MATVTWILLESLPVLGGILFVVLFFLLVRWRQGGTARPLLIGLVVALALLLVQAVVVTNRERAILVMRPIERGLLARDAQPVVDALHADFLADRMDATGFGEFVRAQLGNIQVHRLWRSETVVTDSDAQGFVARLTYYAELTARDVRRPLTSVWDLRFEPDQAEWKIRDIRPVRVADRDLADWAAFRQMR